MTGPIAPGTATRADRNMLSVRIQRASASADLPEDDELRAWAAAALADLDHAAEITLRLVDEAESRQLNARYRQQDKPTNVLSFPAGSDETLKRLLSEAGEPVPLGDLVICAPVVAREASEQGKASPHHWAHMVVHGALHLAGFDHQTPGEAEEMEARERQVLNGLGYPDPYAMA